MTKYSIHMSCAAMLTAAFFAPITANAGVADLQALQAADANLVLQYGFEGTDDSTRLADGSANGFDLQRTQGADSAGTVYDISFVSGYGGVGQAYQPYFDLSGYRVGAGLNTISTAVPVGNAVTVEAVVNMESFAAPTDGSGAYIIDTRPQPNNQRAYFYRQLSTDRISTTMGDTFGDTLDSLSPYASGDWYYLALTASYDIGANQTTVNLYGANLTAGDVTMALLATDNALFQGDWTGDAQVGVGNFMNGSQEFFEGRIDNVALTGQALV